ncbi:MAG: UDP-2,3-diacylglucosamine diphosphatase [Oligoflexia bacterium]|nr:UDP-2,3-diacylglucosamine diphosphatase [Oligoflexia bacterium]
MKSAFFISDVHLVNMASPTGEALLSLVKLAQKEAELFVILGDLFDIWIGEGKAFQAEYAPLIAELKTLRNTCRIIYFEGNHDLHLKKFWQSQLEFEIPTGPMKIDYHDIKIWAEHGDEINRKDYDYLFLRWFLRTPPMKLLIENLPSQLVFNVGHKASHASRQYTEKIKNDSKDIARTYALGLSMKQEFDLLLTGHTHIADDFEFETSSRKARLINLGSWFDGPHYLRVSPAGQITHQKI